MADEMLGRLARYLRRVGYDTAYARGATDAEIARRAATESRRLLTRDRRLAARVPGAILLTEVGIAGQVRELHRLCPDLQWELRPLRCTVCNEPIVRVVASAVDPTRLPERIRRSGQPVWNCPACQRCYWAGSHGDRLAADLGRWIGEGGV
ncbi:MAG: Mut7-C RNAse domain-containing protein [Thermoplasmata archaeon]